MIVSRLLHIIQATFAAVNLSPVFWVLYFEQNEETFEVNHPVKLVFVAVLTTVTNYKQIFFVCAHMEQTIKTTGKKCECERNM